MVDHPQTLPKLPILLLADLYQLNDPVIAQIFTVDEFNVLSTLKRDFIQQRNQYKFLRRTLKGNWQRSLRRMHWRGMRRCCMPRISTTRIITLCQKRH